MWWQQWWEVLPCRRLQEFFARRKSLWGRTRCTCWSSCSAAGPVEDWGFKLLCIHHKWIASATIWKRHNLVLLQGLNEFLTGAKQIVPSPCVLLVVKLHVFPVHLAMINNHDHDGDDRDHGDVGHDFGEDYADDGKDKVKLHAIPGHDHVAFDLKVTQHLLHGHLLARLVHNVVHLVI